MIRHVLARATLALLVVAAAGLAVAFLRGSDPPGPDRAEAVALNWVGEGIVQTARSQGSGWEIDVVRPNGSLVEVTLGASLELLELDEEAAAGGTPAHDEVSGVARRRAIRAALRETGPGRALSVERDPGEGELEVGVRLPDGRTVEVNLDDALRVVDVEPEDPGDE